MSLPPLSPSWSSSGAGEPPWSKESASVFVCTCHPIGPRRSNTIVVRAV